mgnify:CR=1 FL=1
MPAVDPEGEGLEAVYGRGALLQPGGRVVGAVAAGRGQAAAALGGAGAGGCRRSGVEVGRGRLDALQLDGVAGLVIGGAEGDLEGLAVGVNLVQRAQVGRVVGDGQADLLGVAAVRVEHQELPGRLDQHLHALRGGHQGGHPQHKLGLQQRHGRGVVAEDVLRVRSRDHEAGAAGALGRRGVNEHGHNHEAEDQAECAQDVAHDGTPS